MNHLKKFTKRAQTIRLTDAERSAMRAELMAFQKANPLSVQPIRSPYEQFIGAASFFSGNYARVSAFAFALLLLVGITGGTAWAAEGALPGDTLYPLKVSLIEPVQGSFAVSSEAKAEWNTRLVVNRLSEAERLAVRTDLTSATQAELAQSFTTSVVAAKTNIDTVAKKDPRAAARLNLALNSSLTTHGRELATLVGDATSPNAPAVLALAENVEQNIRNTDEGARPAVNSRVIAVAPPVAAKKEAPSSVAVTPGFKTMNILSESSAPAHEVRPSPVLMSPEEQAIFTLRETFALSSTYVDATTTAQVQAALADAEKNLAQAKTARDEGNDRAADAYIAKAHVLTEKSRLLLRLATSTPAFDESNTSHAWPMFFNLRSSSRD